eukprot:360850-Chlamydomonas_euryale.AAC.6
MAALAAADGAVGVVCVALTLADSCAGALLRTSAGSVEGRRDARVSDPQHGPTADSSNTGHQRRPGARGDIPIAQVWVSTRAKCRRMGGHGHTPSHVSVSGRSRGGRRTANVGVLAQRLGISKADD